MVKINYRLVLLLVVALTIIFFFQNGHANPMDEIPPPIPTISPEEQKSAYEEFKVNYEKLNEFLGQNRKYLPEQPLFVGDETDYYYEKEIYNMSSRAGNVQHDYIVQDLVSTARSIHGSNYTFIEKEFYKSNFSVALNIDAVNEKLVETYGEGRFPKIHKGVVIMIDIFDPVTGETIYSGWGKINTDTKKDFNDNGKNYKFADNKVCLAVDSGKKIEALQGKEARLMIFIKNPPTSEFLQQEMANQGTIIRPLESIHF